MLVVQLKKTNYDAKISELEKKLTDHNYDNYINTTEFNTLAACVFNARLARANLITKTDFDAKLSSLNRKITWNKKNTYFDSNYFIGKSHFEEDGTQDYLVFYPIYRYLKRIAGVGNSNYIYYWQSKGLSDEKINSIKTSDYFITPYLRYYVTKTRVEFNGNYLKQDKITYTHRKIVNIYIVYEIVGSSGRNNQPTLQNAQFGAVKLTKTANIDKYRYSSYGIGFD